MPDVAFKDIVIDAHEPAVVGAYWAELLGQTVVDLGDGEVRLGDGPVVWVNRVPEPLGPSRVRLEVRLPGAERSVETDPEGLEWLRFAGSPARAFGLLVDAADPGGLARWWADRTGATVRSHEGHVWLEAVPGMPYDVWAFTPQTDARSVKNRLHWDVTLVDATVTSLVAAGAVVLAELPSWTVLADPEGNEFCVFPATSR